MPEIRVIQLGVMSALRPTGEQSIVVSLFDDGTLLHDRASVRSLHRGQMRDQDAGGVLAKSAIFAGPTATRS
ncbi:MAG: hypothetical protein ABIG63_22025 [Chloroflexota bacterium]